MLFNISTSIGKGIVIDSDEKQNIGHSVLTTVDTHGNYKVEDVIQMYRRNKFQESNHPVFNFSAQDSVIWIGIELESKTFDHTYLSFGDYSNVWKASGYIIDSLDNFHQFLEFDHLKSRPTIGKTLPYQTLAVRIDSLSTSPLILLRISSQSSRNYQYIIAGLANMIDFLHTRELLPVGFIVLMLCMFVYNSFLLISTRDIIYIPYLIYVLYIGFALPFHSGFVLFQNKWMWDYIMAWSSIGYWSATAFAFLYLEMKKTAKWFYRLITTLTLIIGLFYPFLLLTGLSAPSALSDSLYTLSFLYNLILLLAAIYVWTKGYFNARFYVLGWFFVVSSMFVYIFWTNGLLTHQLSEFAVYGGFSFEAMLFAFALGNRMNRLKKEKIAIQQENTNLVIAQNKTLAKQAFMNSHLLRAPLTRLLGLINLLKKEGIHYEEVNKITDLLDKSAIEMDNITKDISSLLEEQGYFDQYQSEFNQIRQEIEKNSETSNSK
ncbi:7TM diverse intracellular signaling domain-containing protein [Reichenbachiella versicolor]|uniref:7TM diverse intracellular signaling domain-containing protein n=1 Tax=Reichenbachiella versicolor TaxID=1821036 RepID=UPI000D6E22BA|nr:7TM diverse intracellular signaling domain-containing protein [Reichenbachiella versicolor]